LDGFATTTERTSDGHRKCAYCGAPATTRDHVPPKCLFPEPLPANLTTVPACQACNNEASGADEALRNILVLWAIERGMPAAELQNVKASRALRRHTKPTMPVLRSICDRPYRRISPCTAATEISVDIYASAIRRIVRGLYCHHYGAQLAIAVPIVVTLLRVDKPGWSRRFGPIARQLDIRVVAGDVFGYAYARDFQKPECSLWVLKFYGDHIVCAVSG
jgi:hypothetical protein